MQIAAVAVTATNMSHAVAFYELLGFRFPPVGPDDQHVEAEAGVRLMIDSAALMTELHGEAPRPGNMPGFALQFATPAEVDEAVSWVSGAGQTVVHGPWDAPWGQRYATVADPDGHRVDLFCPLPG
jgi:catechol 2,3-dioxygenase-like lactoylglutathione lyase family enzyme